MKNNKQDPIYEIDVPKEMDVEPGQILSDLEARTGERKLNIIQTYLNSIPDKVLNINLNEAEKYILLHYHELKIDNETNLILSESKVNKDRFYFQIATLTVSNKDSNEVSEKFRDIKISEIVFNPKVNPVKDLTLKRTNSFLVDKIQNLPKTNLNNDESQSSSKELCTVSADINNERIGKKIILQLRLQNNNFLKHKELPEIKKKNNLSLLPKNKTQVNKGLENFRIS